MIVKCETCDKRFDDEYRLTFCPHKTFYANDGKNNFREHPESYLEKDSGENEMSMKKVYLEFGSVYLIAFRIDLTK